jgi:hypothetical protein
MGTGTLPDNTTIANGLIINPSDILEITSAMEGEFVGRNTSGVATSGQSLGTLLYPWGVGYFNSINVGGSAVDLSGIVSPANRIVSGAVRTTSGQPQFLQANGSAASVKILGATTNLVLSINSTTATVSTDITISSLTTAPSSNNTCAINQSMWADEAASKYYGEIDSDYPTIPIDTVGSEISARVGQFVTFKTDTSEYMFGWLKSATEFVAVKRGFFFDSSLAPVVREMLINNEVLTLMETGWIFVENDGLTTDVTYLTPVYAYTAPGSPVATQYWYDIANATWKRYSGSAWVDVGRMLVGLCVINTSNCIATRSFDFYGDYREENTIQAEVFSDTVIRSTRTFNSINVYGTNVVIENYPVEWDNTANMETGAIGNDTEYYLYLDVDGQPKISLERPYDRHGDLRGHYHPYNNWRFICKANTDGAADWLHVLGNKSTQTYNTGLDFDAVGLLINVYDTETLSISFKKLTLRDPAGNEKILYNKSYLVDITATGICQGTELASTIYCLWFDGEKFKLVPDIEGTTDGTTSDFLVDSANEFATYGVKKGDLAYNTTDYNVTTVSVSATADNADLAVSADNFADTETYKIHMLNPEELSSFACHIGYGRNDGSSNIVDCGYTRPELQTMEIYSEAAEDFAISDAISWSTITAEQTIHQCFDFGKVPVWYIKKFIIIGTDASNVNITLTCTNLDITYDSPGFGTETNVLRPVTGIIKTGSSNNILATVGATITNWTLEFNGIRLNKKPPFAIRN